MRYAVNTPNVISEEVAGQAVVIDFDSGRYFSLNESGSTVWQLLQDGVAVESLRARTGDDIARAGLDAFLDALLAANLVHRETDEAEPAADGEPLALDPAPLLESFDDLQDILLLDPIHEVDEKGWPHATAATPAG